MDRILNISGILSQLPNNAEHAPPVNFDNFELDNMFCDWLTALREFSVKALIILGPDPFGQRRERKVAAVYPPRFMNAARALAQSEDFGAQSRELDAPLVDWQDIEKSDQKKVHADENRWRLLCQAHGVQHVVRVEFPLPSGRSFECFIFSSRQLRARDEAAALAWSALNIWPLVKRSMAEASSPLSPRERQCLSLAFEGLTARQSAERLHCAERTVTYHLSNAMAKLKADSKMLAIHRACLLGLI